MPAWRVLLTRSGCRVIIAAIPPPNAYTAQINARRRANEPNTSTGLRLSPGQAGSVIGYLTLLCRSGRSGNGSPRSRLVFGRALRLDYLGDKAPVRRPALDQRLRFIHESIRQRVTAHIAHRERLPFPFENKINAAGETANGACRYGSA